MYIYMQKIRTRILGTVAVQCCFDSQNRNFLNFYDLISTPAQLIWHHKNRLQPRNKLQQVRVWSSHKSTGFSPETSVIWTWSNRT